MLPDSNLPTGFAFFAFDLRQFDGQDAIFDLGANLCLIHIVRQRVFLLEVGVCKLAAEVVGMFVFLFVLKFVLDGNAQIAKLYLLIVN